MNVLQKIKNKVEKINLSMKDKIYVCSMGLSSTIVFSGLVTMVFSIFYNFLMGKLITQHNFLLIFISSFLLFFIPFLIIFIEF